MRVLIGVPVYNEEQYIERVLNEVKRHCSDILVVDDGSTDGTAARLANVDGIVVHTHGANEGYGRSLISIFAYAIEQGYDWVITLDADEQHEPGAIVEFVRVAEADQADIISGSRYIDHTLHDGAAPDERRWINCQITEVLRYLTPYALTDSFCGFKAYRVESLRKLSLVETGYSMPLQLWIQAARADLRVVEIPVKLIYKDPNRTFGGDLDDAQRRLRYYLDTLSREIGRPLEAVCDGHKVDCPCR
ncbi:MAG: glycosyltransferase [Anaerolineaceae bacterium]|nr:glycosyltransferase [Anaerolineaceae bacterium]